ARLRLPRGRARHRGPDCELLAAGQHMSARLERSVPALAVASLLASGCLSTPSPLAPSFHGTIGAPNQGVQTGAVELPASGPGFVRFRPQGPHHFGRPRLVAALTRIARELQGGDASAPPLVIGDLSAKTGGKID